MKLPVHWYQWGPVSAWLARRSPPLSPPVLVLSLGRSGSSWVGNTLGRARNALCLREPLTQNLLEAGGPQTNFEVSPENPPTDYQRWALAAFLGLPTFRSIIVRHPEQWHYGERGRRRLVIKEINPFACAWLLQTYHPRLIYLVRHPAAVALSNLRLGFVGGPGLWRLQGEHQGRAHQYVLACLKNWQDYQIVQYETLCADPVGQFRELFEFAQIDWDETMANYIVEHTSGGDRNKPYGLSRNSREMIDSWREEIAPESLSELQRAYQAYELPWYRLPEDWQLEGVRP